MDLTMHKKKKIPSLLDLCIQTAIDNLRYMADVGEVDAHLLQRILPHCDIDQLRHIENSTEGRDLSSVTDDLWKRFYEKDFGKESSDVVIGRMRQKQVVFKWRQLYEAKYKEREAFKDKLKLKLKQRYQEEEEKKLSRQVKYTKKEPPSSCKRSYPSGSTSYNVSNLKSNILKKAKLESLQSHEAKIHATMRKNALQRKISPPERISRASKPSNFLRTSLASSSKLSKPPGRG
ncbi:uncharacterized protein A4U43_C03F920 [Asparagus officinalis]|uniref:Elongin-A n=1 Tax=Asparagus officinalis TaxID=4686 RepID=A0A5P1F6D0_ASPOF|nr:uncharacterized protein LOC109832610 [Asparagus officinalis]ONK73918.1 uncharacterized protein A4U43_C03F920 [Asparagus officinalis]